MTPIRWTIFGLICVLTLGGVVLMSKKDNVNVDAVDPAKIITKTNSMLGDNVYGNKDAKVIVFEYGDFQCPSCGSVYLQLKSLKEVYKDSIAFVFRNFPLTNIHPNALAASTAAEAAGLQGKFWEMHDKLYENQNAWSSVDASKRTDSFTQYAEQLGLDTTKFKADLSSKDVINKISRDRALGGKLKVDATPTIYVGNEKLSSEDSSELVNGKGDKLKAKIDAALKAAGVAIPAN